MAEATREPPRRTLPEGHAVCSLNAGLPAKHKDWIAITRRCGACAAGPPFRAEITRMVREFQFTLSCQVRRNSSTAPGLRPRNQASLSALKR